MLRDDERYREMREFSRVDARIPLEVSRVPGGMREGLRSRISGETVPSEMRALPDLGDKLLTDWLKMLNTKLDTLISMLVLQKEGFSSLSLADVNISGGGMSFVSREEYGRGEVLELKMMLPLLPPVALYAYGEVVKEEAEAGSRRIAVRFIAMDEKIRDEVVRFVFRRQRDLLRELRR